MKNPIRFLYALVFSLFAFISCEQDNEETNEPDPCTAINALEIVATENQSSAPNTSEYTFTVSDTSLKNAVFKWYINGKPKGTNKKDSSIIRHRFSENGTYEICLETSLSENTNCESKKICTTLVFDNFTEAKDECNLLRLDHLKSNSNNPIIVEKVKGLSQDGVAARFILNGDDVKQFRVYVDEKNSNFEHVVDANPAIIFDQRTFHVPFTKMGIYNVKIVAIGKSCPEEQVFYAKVTVNSKFQARITLLGKELNNDANANNPDTQNNCFNSTFDVLHMKNWKESFFGFSPYLYSAADDITYTWSLDGEVLSENERIALSGRPFVLPFTAIMRLCNGEHTVSVHVISPTVCPNGTTFSKTFTTDYNLSQCGDNEITPSNEPKQLTCNNIDLLVRAQPEFNGASCSASYIKDASYTWFINGNEVQESDLSGTEIRGIKLTNRSFFELGKGTHEVKVTVVSPSICPNGITLTKSVTIQ